MKRSGYRGGESSGKKPKIEKEEEEVMEKKGRKVFTLEIGGAPREIEVLVTGVEGSVKAWISRAVGLYGGKEPMIFGLNVHETSKKKLATIELGVGSRSLVFQVSHCPNPPPRMVELFANTGNLFITYGDAEKTLRMLDSVGITVSRCGDMSSIVKEAKNKPPATADWKRFAGERIGFDLKQLKEPEQPNWNAEELKDKEWKFACMLVLFAMKVGKKFLDK